jgi:hypothetical protein
MRLMLGDRVEENLIRRVGLHSHSPARRGGLSDGLTYDSASSRAALVIRAPAVATSTAGTTMEIVAAGELLKSSGSRTGLVTTMTPAPYARDRKARRATERGRTLVDASPRRADVSGEGRLAPRRHSEGLASRRVGSVSSIRHAVFRRRRRLALSFTSSTCREPCPFTPLLLGLTFHLFGLPTRSITVGLLSLMALAR